MKKTDVLGMVRAWQRGWKLLFAIMLTWSFMGCQSYTMRATQVKLSCSQVPTSKLTGWLDRFEGPCAILWRSEERILVVHRRALPKTAKEGDYVHQGKIDAFRTQRLKQQIHNLLERPPAPRVVKLTQQAPRQARRKIQQRDRKRCKNKAQRRRRKHILSRHRWKHRTWRRRWQRWSRRSRCRHYRWQRWSKIRHKHRWFRLNTYND